MRSMLLVAGVLAALGTHTVHRAALPESCYIAKVALIVEDVSDYKFHRIVVSGIEKVPAAPESTEQFCQPRDLADPAVLTVALDGAIDPASVVPPVVRANADLQAPAIASLRDQIRRLAERARAHRGTFRWVEIVRRDSTDRSASALLDVGSFTLDSADARACLADNERLAKANARTRWAC